jgi:hypothetical protein
VATSLTVDEVREQLRGQDTPQNEEQAVSFAIWQQLPEQWLREEEFESLLRHVAGSSGSSRPSGGRSTRPSGSGIWRCGSLIDPGYRGPTRRPGDRLR